MSLECILSTAEDPAVLKSEGLADLRLITLFWEQALLPGTPQRIGDADATMWGWGLLVVAKKLYAAQPYVRYDVIWPCHLVRWHPDTNSSSYDFECKLVCIIGSSSQVVYMYGYNSSRMNYWLIDYYSIILINKKFTDARHYWLVQNRAKMTGSTHWLSWWPRTFIWMESTTFSDMKNHWLCQIRARMTGLSQCILEKIFLNGVKIFLLHENSSSVPEASKNDMIVLVCSLDAPNCYNGPCSFLQVDQNGGDDPVCFHQPTCVWCYKSLLLYNMERQAGQKEWPSLKMMFEHLLNFGPVWRDTSKD